MTVLVTIVVLVLVIWLVLLAIGVNKKAKKTWNSIERDRRRRYEDRTTTDQGDIS